MLLKQLRETRNIEEISIYLLFAMLHIRTIIVFVGILCLDMVSKIIFYDNAIWADTLLLSPHFNTGIAWSLPVPFWLILLLTAMVVGGLCFLYYKKQLLRRVFALLMAGSIGNMYDRVVLWWVRDFIAIGSFPVFNIADVAISLAALAMIVSILFPWKFGMKE